MPTRWRVETQASEAAITIGALPVSISASLNYLWFSPKQDLKSFNMRCLLLPPPLCILQYFFCMCVQYFSPDPAQCGKPTALGTPFFLFNVLYHCLFSSIIKVFGNYIFYQIQSNQFAGEQQQLACLSLFNFDKYNSTSLFN